MPVLANSRVYVEQPGSLVPRYGLFTAANGPLDMPDHAVISGLEYEVPNCGLPTGVAINCAVGDQVTKTFDTGGFTLASANPFIVRSSMTCAAVGLTEDRLRRLLMAKLTAGEQAAVETIFSAGTFGVAPSLSNNTPAATNAGASTTLTKALDLLEVCLYSTYGVPGVIHVPIGLANDLKNQHLIWKDGLVWRTALGTAVSIGNYTAEGPAGEDPAANTFYLYITGQVTIWRTPDSKVFINRISEGLNRTTNQVTAHAEREYIISFDCKACYTLLTLS